MNDEIKEILEQLEWYRKIGKKDVYYPECVLPNKKAFILLDYITNLQQIEQEHQRINGELREENSKLEIALQNIQEDYDRRTEENERLKAIWKDTNVIVKDDKTFVMNTNAYECLEDYKSRCEKASEYIKQNEFYLDYKTGACIKGVMTLLNILQNGSDDNE